VHQAYDGMFHRMRVPVHRSFQTRRALNRSEGFIG
jgi:hypothetical protein